MTKTIVVMNRHIIQRNRKNGTKEAPIRVSRGRYGRPSYFHDLVLGPDAHLIYDPENPLPCGATAWIEYG
jgi:hypothetical protein